MNTYSYEIITKNQKRETGIIDAKDKYEVVKIFQAQDAKVTHVEDYVNLSFSRISNLSFGGIPTSEKVIFMKQFSTMVDAGLPISSALETLAFQTSDNNLKTQLKKVLSDVQSGNSLYNAFSNTKGIFTDIQMNLLKAGESSGMVDEILRKITSDLERNKNFVSKIQGAMIYPAVILVAAIVVVWVLVVYMMPSIETLFKELKAEDQTPAITKFLISASDFLNPTSGIGFYTILIVLFGGFLVFRFYRNSDSGRYLTDLLFTKIPIFGPLYSKLDIAQFCRIFSMLLSSGVNISEAINITSGAVDNVVTKKAILAIIPEIEKGGKISTAMERSVVFPPVLVRMVDTGEKTGKLDLVLAQMAKFYEDEVDNMSSNLTKLIEPAVLLVVGVFVAILAVAVYLPIYQISQAFSR
jgi:type IV pilus assembly protein PilC